MRFPAPPAIKPHHGSRSKMVGKRNSLRVPGLGALLCIARPIRLCLRNDPRPAGPRRSSKTQHRLLHKKILRARARHLEASRFQRKLPIPGGRQSLRRIRGAAHAVPNLAVLAGNNEREILGKRSGRVLSWGGQRASLVESRNRKSPRPSKEEREPLWRLDELTEAASCLS